MVLAIFVVLVCVIGFMESWKKAGIIFAAYVVVNLIVNRTTSRGERLGESTYRTQSGGEALAG